MKLPILLYNLLISRLGKDDMLGESDQRVVNNQIIEKPISSKKKASNSKHIYVAEPKKLEKSSPSRVSEMKEDKENGEEKKSSDFYAGGKEVALLHYLKDLEDFEEILHRLNCEGENEGVAFKRGRVQYWKDNSIKYKSIICSCTSRYSKFTQKNKDKTARGSLENLTSNSQVIEVEFKASYRIKYEKGTKNFLGIISSNEFHQGHEFKVKKMELSEKMLQEIQNFNKSSSVIIIKEFLEQKFKVSLRYTSVYSEFRRVFPLFGSQDATKFITWCRQHDFLVEKEIDEINNSYTKLFICSKLMKEHYKLYGDVVLLDSTYRVNKYKLPVVVFSGFTHTGRNCIFGIGIVNNETESTYQWLISQFFTAHRALCSIIVSDHDPAMEAVLDKHYKNISHLLCRWHILQNFAKNFSYLAGMKLTNVREKILALPYVELKEDFEQNFSDIKKVLEEKKFEKSLSYLNKMYQIKRKWVEAFLPDQFTGGVHTTSRVESLNALIKRYLSSKNEISDLIRFLKNFEEKFVFDENILESENISKEKDQNVESKNKTQSIKHQYETHPILLDLKTYVSQLIFVKHLEQFKLCHNYVCKHSKTESKETLFKISCLKSANPDKYREVILSSDKYHCNCSTYHRHGLICRHIFSLAIMFQDKNCEKFLIHKRWNLQNFKDQIENQNFIFNTDGISKYLKETDPEREPDVMEKNQGNPTNFQTIKRGRGAPKKDKRAKSALEKKSNSKKGKKKELKKSKTISVYY